MSCFKEPGASRIVSMGPLSEEQKEKARKLQKGGKVIATRRRRSTRRRRTKDKSAGHGSRDKISTDFAGDSSLAAYFSQHAPQRERSDREITRF